MITHCTTKSYMCLRKYLDSFPEGKLPRTVEGCKFKSPQELHRIFGDFISIRGYGGMNSDMVRMMESSSRTLYFEMHHISRNRGSHHGCTVHYASFSWASEIFEILVQDKINSLEVIK